MSDRTDDIVTATVPAVAASIRELRAHKIHPHFAGYLCVLRAAAAAGTEHGLVANFAQFFDEFLTYGSASPDIPYVVPFTNSTRAKVLFRSNYPAGSYAKSSLRLGQPFREVVDVHGERVATRYSLKDNHAAAALQHLLFGRRAPLVPLALFLYRDYGIMSPAEASSTDHRIFVEEFMSEFGLLTSKRGTEVFESLFEVDALYLSNTPVAQRVSGRGAT